MSLQDKLKKLEEHVCEQAQDHRFIHHQWFVKHHLKIIEQLVNQLCDLYPEANRDAAMAMVWLHDFGKIIMHTKSDRDKETDIMLAEGKALLEKLEFPTDFITKVIADLTVFEQAKTRDLSQENIEVQIVSSADGSSHFAMPFFFSSFWQDSPHTSFEDLVKENKRKSTYDWTRKIVLPEAKKAFQSKISAIMDYNPDDIGKVFI